MTELAVALDTEDSLRCVVDVMERAHIIAARRYLNQETQNDIARAIQQYGDERAREAMAAIDSWVTSVMLATIEESAACAKAIGDRIEALADAAHAEEKYELYEELEAQAGLAGVIEVAIRALAAKPEGWQPIATAPTDGTFVWVWVAPLDELPGFIDYACYYHDTGGWCRDELRETTLWQPAPAPPEAPK